MRTNKRYRLFYFLLLLSESVDRGSLCCWVAMCRAKSENLTRDSLS